MVWWQISWQFFTCRPCVMTSFVDTRPMSIMHSALTMPLVKHRMFWIIKKPGNLAGSSGKKLTSMVPSGAISSWNECGFVGDQPTNWKRPQLNKLQTQGEKTIGDANMILILCSMCICIYWYETPKDISIIWLKTQGYFRISSRGEIFVSTGKLRCTIQPGPNIHWC